MAGRHKAAQNVKILPWLSGRRDCKEGRFLQVGNSLLLSETFGELSGNAVKTYFALCMEAGGKQTVSFPRARAPAYGISTATFTRAIQELTEAGLISHDFDDNKYRYQANVYRFKVDWKPP